MTHAINLLDLDNVSNQLLITLFNDNPDINDWLPGIYSVNSQLISISHRIIKHLNSTSEKSVYEVLDHGSYGNGCFGSLYLSKVTLVPNEHKNELIVKIKSEEKQRLVKIQDFKYFSKERAAKEVYNLGQAGFFNCKPLSVNETQSFITMRKLPGETLHKIIEANKLTLLERFELTKALVLALKDQVHDHDLIHRDIKPLNIMVNKEYEIRYIDFALAILKNYDDRVDKLRGCLPYASPEAYSLYKCTNVKSDIYALGRALMMLWGDDYNNNSDFTPKDPVYSAKNVSFVTLFDRMDEIPACHMEIRALLVTMLHADAEKRPYFDEIMDSLNLLNDKLQPIANPKKKSTMFLKSESLIRYDKGILDNISDEEPEYGCKSYYGF